MVCCLKCSLQLALGLPFHTQPYFQLFLVLCRLVSYGYLNLHHQYNNITSLFFCLTLHGILWQGN